MRKKRKNTLWGTGLLGVIAGALASWFLFGTEKGEETIKDIKKIAKDVKEEIEKRVDQAGDITEEKYNEIVDEVSEKYYNVKNIDKKELEEMVDEMKGHWKSIKKQVMDGKKIASKSRRRSK